MSAEPVPGADPPPGFGRLEWRLVRQVLDSMSDVQLAAVALLLEHHTAPTLVPRLRAVEDT
jgi:hypothetical protein